jgi:hypothetical protein
MVIAAPSMVPEAAAAGALYVSAENAEYNNCGNGFLVVKGGPFLTECVPIIHGHPRRDCALL